MSANKPAVFIGSSLEGLRVARLFHEELSREIEPALWSQPGMFEPSEFNLESLEAALERFRFALLVLSPRDVLRSGGVEEMTARDNVIFELGLFAGRHGRRSVFLAVPDFADVEIPSDLKGLTLVEYRASSRDGVPRFDVTAACSKIIRALEERSAAAEPGDDLRPSRFWDVLTADTIIVLYGVESAVDWQNHPRHRVSLRDTETAWELKSFLERRYPGKRVWPIPTTAPGWERLMQTGADFVIIGGFVANPAFAKLRTDYERFFRLRMGRLCVVDGQQVHLPRFDVPPGGIAPDRRNPHEVAEYPTELVTQDWGFISNTTMHVYGQDRRVVAIAGIKGHGTRGAALYACDARRGLDSHLENHGLSAADTLELVVSVRVSNDVVHRVAPAKILLNGNPIFIERNVDNEPCELSRPCEGCDFAVFQPPASRRAASAGSLATRVAAIVFDLDDTLFDTFGSLIVPLEIEAALRMCDAHGDVATMAATLLRLRRDNPRGLEAELRRAFPHVTPEKLQIRKRLLDRVPLSGVKIKPEVVEMLERLRPRFELYLLTASSSRFQNAKIDRLNIRSLFKEIIVVGRGSVERKMEAIKALSRRRGFKSDSVLIVGNRLDDEILVGSTLKMPTVWLRHGEGSGLMPEAGAPAPSYILGNVLELGRLLDQ